MTISYLYDISDNILGGLVTSNTIVRLTTLCRLNIATPLENISVTNGTLSLVFSGSLAAPEKTTLDNDTIPAGGLIEQCADYIEILVAAIPRADFYTVHNNSDGFSSVDIVLQRKKGNGVNRLGTSEEVEIEMFGSIFMNNTIGNFDPLTGQFNLKLMPSKDRTLGFFSFMILTETLPTRVLSVHLDSHSD